MKRIITIVLASLMIIVMCFPALAAYDTNTGDGTITVNNALVGETYTIYRLAELHSFSGSSFSYYVNDTWRPFFTTAAAQKYFTVNSDGYLTMTNEIMQDANKINMVNDALAYIEEKSVANNGQKIAETTSVTFENLPLGYYLIDTTAGILCMIDTTTKSITVNEKNTPPTIQKQVLEDSTQTWGDKNSAAITQPIDFRIVVSVGTGTNNYEVHDTMTNLKLDETSFVLNMFKSGQATSTVVDPAYYTVTVGTLTTSTDSGVSTDTQTFTIKFSDDYIDTLITGDHIDITYKTSLTENAVIDKANPNDVYLSYGSASKTATDTTETYTYAFDLVKTDFAGTLLNGAVFELYVKKDAETYGAVTLSYENGVYYVQSPDGTGVATPINVVNGGPVRIYGLDNDTNYVLKEIKAPEGYNPITGYTDPIVITSASGSILIKNDLSDGKYESNDGGVQIVNRTGSELPATGGAGTTALITIGAILVLFAGVLLVTKMRMAKIED